MDFFFSLHLLYNVDEDEDDEVGVVLYFRFSVNLYQKAISRVH